MPPYTYTVDESVLQIFANASKRHRAELLRIFDFIAKDPFIEGDALQKDRSGRRCNVKQFGRWTITWWPEHLAKQVHILDAERLI